MAGELNINKVLRLPAKKFAEWERYAALEPFGEMRADWRAASVRQMIFNMAVDPKNRKSMEEFLLRFNEEEEQKEKEKQHQQQSAEEQVRMIKAYVMAYGMAAEAEAAAEAAAKKLVEGA